jgi:hypothetical protein
LLKLNSNTAGLPSVAEAGGSWLQLSRIIIIDCSSRSRSRGNVKSRYFHQSYQQLLVHSRF